MAFSPPVRLRSPSDETFAEAVSAEEEDGGASGKTKCPLCTWRYWLRLPLCVFLVLQNILDRSPWHRAWPNKTKQKTWGLSSVCYSADAAFRGGMTARSNACERDSDVLSTCCTLNTRTMAGLGFYFTEKGEHEWFIVRMIVSLVVVWPVQIGGFHDDRFNNMSMYFFFFSNTLKWMEWALSWNTMFFKKSHE